MIGSSSRTWFPFILSALTLALLAAVLFLFGPTWTKEPPDETIPAAPTIPEYSDSARRLLNDFLIDWETVDVDEDRSRLTQDVQNRLLELIVPADYREWHLEMVIALNLIVQGCDVDDQTKIVEGMRRVEVGLEQL